MVMRTFAVRSLPLNAPLHLHKKHNNFKIFVLCSLNDNLFRYHSQCSQCKLMAVVLTKMTVSEVVETSLTKSLYRTTKMCANKLLLFSGYEYYLKNVNEINWNFYPRFFD